MTEDAMSGSGQDGVSAETLRSISTPDRVDSRLRTLEFPERGAPQMPEWNVVTMGRAGLPRWTGEVAQPVARSIARGTGQAEARR
jgi:hypothetical protein